MKQERRHIRLISIYLVISKMIHNKRLLFYCSPQLNCCIRGQEGATTTTLNTTFIHTTQIPDQRHNKISIVQTIRFLSTVITFALKFKCNELISRRKSKTVQPYM